MTQKKQFNFNQALKDLEEINQWFQQEDIDLEQGLQKLKQGKELIAQCRARLKEVENEFVAIQKDESEPVTSSQPSQVDEAAELPF